MRTPSAPPSDEVRRQLDDCTYCPKMCRHACPVSTTTGRESQIPQRKMARLGELEAGSVPWDAAHADPLWACTGCRHCTLYCEHDNEPGLVLLTGRAQAVARGAGHPALADYPHRFDERERRLREQVIEQFPEDRASAGSIGFWPGCDSVGKSPADVTTSLRLLRDAHGAGVSLIDAPQVCAGYPLLAAGYPDLFRWHAAKVAATMQRFATVVMNCSACLHSVRAQYPGEGLAIPARVLSLAEALAEGLPELDPTPDATPTASKRTVYYHDPCYLARYAGVVDEPRRLLSRVAEVREFAWSHGDTECCGGGGMLPKTDPTAADAMARRRLAEVQAKGGGMVVTSCGTCAFMLKQNAPSAVEVHDLPSALASLSGVAAEPVRGFTADDD